MRGVFRIVCIVDFYLLKMQPVRAQPSTVLAFCELELFFISLVVIASSNTLKMLQLGFAFEFILKPHC